MTDVVKIITDYQAWVDKQEWANPTGPDAYAEHLETQKELRILKAARHYFENGAADLDYLGAIFDGDDDVLREEESTYEA